MKTRLLSLLALAALALSGCSTPIRDITPARLEANPSGIYTFRMEATPPKANVVEGSIRAQIVINGEVHDMYPSETLGRKVYEYEYRVPASVSDVSYYYVVTYEYIQDGRKRQATHYSTDSRPDNRLNQARIVNRYVVQLGTTRSPVGVPVSVMGAGFSQYDRVKVGDAEAETRYISPTTLTFTVPALPAGRTYEVSVVTGEGELNAGRLRIDSSSITVQPARVSLSAGDREQLTFIIDGPAAPGGLNVTVETDIPASVIMPEVTIPPGARSVSVTVQGGGSGKGKLVISAPGYDPVTVPIEVQ